MQEKRGVDIALGRGCAGGQMKQVMNGSVWEDSYIEEGKTYTQCAEVQLISKVFTGTAPAGWILKSSSSE